MIARKTANSFKINPVELVIFAAISGIFCHSAYRLLSDGNGFRWDALRPVAENLTTATSNRAPASIAPVTPILETIVVRCDDSDPTTTSADKVRLQFPDCAASATSATALSETAANDHLISVTNLKNAISATVIPEHDKKTFSTEYLSLEMGENTVQIKTQTPDGKATDREVMIIRK